MYTDRLFQVLLQVYVCDLILPPNWIHLILVCFKLDLLPVVTPGRAASPGQ